MPIFFDNDAMSLRVGFINHNLMREKGNEAIARRKLSDSNTNDREDIADRNGRLPGSQRNPRLSTLAIKTTTLNRIHRLLESEISQAQQAQSNFVARINQFQIQNWSLLRHAKLSNSHSNNQ
ncbi:MAG: hypothetical protein NTW52_01160 [Planctomycetota bacterium]|nr:hypothetical protein [Planctomycetota bacterium]